MHQAEEELRKAEEMLLKLENDATLHQVLQETKTQERRQQFKDFFAMPDKNIGVQVNKRIDENISHSGDQLHHHSSITTTHPPITIHPPSYLFYSFLFVAQGRVVGDAR